MARRVAQDARRVVLFGSQFDALTSAEACDAMEAMIRAGDRRYLVCVKDVALTIRSREDAFLRRFYARADLTLVDGRGLLLAGRLLGQRLPAPVGGPNLYREMLRRASSCGYSVYLLGARAEVLEEAVRRLRVSHPTLRLAGRHHGYFAGWELEVVEDIERTRPEILFVGISTPERERFLDAWLERLPPGVCIPVGGVIDIEAGVVARAPDWIGRSGLEWLFRIVQEPGRLLPRYARTHSRFAALLAGALLSRLWSRRTSRH